MKYVKQALESIDRKVSTILKGCSSIRTERFTGIDSKFRLQEILLLSTMLPVVFLDIYTQKAWVAAFVVLLEAAAFVLSFFRAIEQAKTGQKHSSYGLLQFLLVVLVVDLCLLAVCRVKYAALFCDESEKFMLACFLRKGYRLYDTVFCHHGPFTVMLSHLVYLLHPVNDIGIFRAPGFLVLLLPSILFLFTDIVPKRTLRITASLVFPCSYLLLAYFYSCVQGAPFSSAIVLYQFYGSVFIGCALILLYPLLFQDRYNRWHLFWAGMFLSFSFFSAISFSVSIFLIIVMAGIFFLCNLPQSAKKFWTLLFFVYGGIAGLLLVLLYLRAFGSVRGFIDQHILFNLQVYSKYIGYDQSGVGYLRMIPRIPKQVLHGGLFYLALLTVFVLLYPLFASDCAGNKKQKVLHFVYSVMFFLIALFSGRYSPFEGGFTPVYQSGYVVLILAECVFLLGLTPRRAWLLIALGFLTMVAEMAPHCRRFSRPTFPQLNQKAIASSEIVQALTGPEDPVLFYALGFSDYIGENRLPGGVSFPFITAWVYEYGRDRLFDEICQTQPVMIGFYYSYEAWYVNDAMISEILDFMKSMGYMQINDTFYYILPECCTRQEELAQYDLVPVARPFFNADPGALHPFEEINRDRVFSDTLIYPDKVGDRMVSGISFSIPTYTRTRSELDGQMEVRFLDDRDETIEVFSMDVQDMKDNQSYLFAFEKPCRPTSIRISSTSSPQKGFSLWVDPDNHLSFVVFEDPVSLSRDVYRGPASIPE